MFVAGVCFMFLMKLKWPKSKNIYDTRNYSERLLETPPENHVSKMANRRNDILRGELVFRKENCSPFDIGILFNDISSFSDTRKLKVIEKVWNPHSDPFIFPRTTESEGRSQKFNHTWP